MPRAHVSGRPLSALRFDTRKNLDGKSVQFLRVYVGRIAVRMLVAEELIEEQEGFPAIPPAAFSILRLLQPLALEKEE